MSFFELIMSETIHQFSVMFVLAAMWTRKDLAIMAAGIAVASSLVWQKGYEPQLTFTIFCALNCLLVMVAASYASACSHESIRICPLSKVTMALCLTAAILNFMSVFFFVPLMWYLSNILGILLLSAIFFLDGRKGLLNGLYDDLRGVYLRRVHKPGANSRDKDS